MKKDERIKRLLKAHLYIATAMLGILILFPAHPGLSQNREPSGKNVYADNCASCHEGGFRGWITGAPKTGDQEEWNRFLRNGADKMVENTLNGTKGMKPKGGCEKCTKEEIRAAVDYIIHHTQ